MPDDDPAVPDLPDLPDLGGLAGSLGGMPDLGSMLDGLGKVQAIQQAAFEGSAGGGLVRVRATGRMDVESVTIDPKAIDPDDPDLLADLVLAALRDLTAQIAAAQRDAMGPLGDILGQ